MGSIYPGGGYPAQYSQGGSIPVIILIEPDLYITVPAPDRWVIVPAEPA